MGKMNRLGMSTSINMVLPPEIIQEILVRLPIKSILICKSVCISWRSLIETSTFVQSHRNHYNKNNGQPLLLLHSLPEGEVDTFSLLWDNNGSSSCHEYIKLGNPFQRYYSDHRDRFIFSIGACNGLVCLVHRSESPVFIWNPCIRKFLMLPCDVPNDVRTVFKPRVMFAFGYEPRTDDYKLLRRVSRRVEIWSLANGSWKTLSDAAVPSYFYRVKDVYHGHTCIHGRLHWAGQQKHNYFIVVFDLFSESFHKLMLPEALRKTTHKLYFGLPMLGESLGLCLYESQPIIGGFQLWVLKEYGVAESWAKLITIRREASPFIMLGLRNSGQVVLYYLILKQMKLIDLKTKKIEDFQIDQHSRCYCFMRSFVENFALLDHPDAISY